MLNPPRDSLLESACHHRLESTLTPQTVLRSGHLIHPPSALHLTLCLTGSRSHLRPSSSFSYTLLNSISPNYPTMRMPISTC
ncbi:unnamed protein product [Protopolystoma xenopodis]|uniref:Uncharacterized protein n=1 Tax=Protopolystoma xenopodis TaxID=117903 RepID=A0A448X6K8_9PLAT|nr:unnamed protein product [Protopolystoma xenopodis]